MFIFPGVPFLKHMDVSENSGTPKSSNLIGFSIINHPFWGTPIFGNTHISEQLPIRVDPAELLPCLIQKDPPLVQCLGEALTNQGVAGKHQKRDHEVPVFEVYYITYIWHAYI